MVLTSDSAKRRFGVELRKYRERAGVSQSSLARDIPLAQSMLSAIELGKKTTKEPIVARIDELLSTNGALLKLWSKLRRQGGGHAEWFEGIVEQEKKASMIREYGLALIPGLLQTRNYAHVLIRDARPTDPESEINNLVTVRIERQELLEAERAPQLSVVLDETALTRPVGGREIMREQVERLLRATESERVTIQVIPFVTERRPGLSGPFTLITTPGEPEILYVETPLTGAAVDDPEKVAHYAMVFGTLQGVALPPQLSRQRMCEIKEMFQ